LTERPGFRLGWNPACCKVLSLQRVISLREPNPRKYFSFLDGALSSAQHRYVPPPLSHHHRSTRGRKSHHRHPPHRHRWRCRTKTYTELVRAPYSAQHRYVPPLPSCTGISPSSKTSNEFPWSKNHEFTKKLTAVFPSADHASTISIKSKHMKRRNWQQLAATEARSRCAGYAAIDWRQWFKRTKQRDYLGIQAAENPLGSAAPLASFHGLPRPDTHDYAMRVAAVAPATSNLVPVLKVGASALHLLAVPAITCASSLLFACQEWNRLGSQAAENSFRPCSNTTPSFYGLPSTNITMEFPRSSRPNPHD
jgi:hypothetical protein